jgi:hypothetical protein
MKYFIISILLVGCGKDYKACNVIDESPVYYALSPWHTNKDCIPRDWLEDLSYTLTDNMMVFE